MAPTRESRPYRKALGEAIRARRKRLDLSQEEIADRASVDRTYLTGLESGARNPTLETIIRIAGALGTKPSRLMATAESKGS